MKYHEFISAIATALIVNRIRERKSKGQGTGDHATAIVQCALSHKRRSSSSVIYLAFASIQYVFIAPSASIGHFGRS